MFNSPGASTVSEIVGRNGSDESQRLLEKARAGNDSALWALGEQLRPYLKGIVRKNLGPDLVSKVDDSDVVQQSMIRAVNKFENFRGETVAEWQAWLIAIAQNEARNTVRYWHQQRRDAYRERMNDSQNRNNATADQSTPSQIVVRRERAAQLMAAISKLKEDQQQLITWRHFENRSHREIADRLGISEDAVRQRWKSVLDKLMQLWDSKSAR